MSVNSTNPGTWLGGTWEQIQDRFLLAAGTTYSAGSTGGSANAVVVSHNHTRLIYTGNNYWTIGDNTGLGGKQKDANSVNLGSPGQDVNVERSHYATNYTGESGTGKNMPPYLAVYIWKRTA